MMLVFIFFALTTFAASLGTPHGSCSNNNVFNKNFIREISKKNDNLCVSPLSLFGGLSMLSQGSKGSTAKDFMTALGIDLGIAGDFYNGLAGSLKNFKKVNLHMANKIYVKKGAPIKKKFKDTITKKFHAHIENIDFTKPDVADNINKWCRDNTNNKVDKLFKKKDFDSKTRMVLLNALYFYGKWEKQFDKKKTKKQKFYVNNKDTVNCDMMQMRHSCLYAESKELDAQILRLKYQDNMAMSIILPKKKDGIKALESKLTTVNMDDILKGCRDHDVDVQLPKFKIETEIDLKQILSTIGLSGMFGNSADFSDFFDNKERLNVDIVRQKACIDVNEEGTEAAVVTGEKVKIFTAPAPLKKVKFEANRPFIFQIHANVNINVNVNVNVNLPQSEILLFHGKVCKF